MTFCLRLPRHPQDALAAIQNKAQVAAQTRLPVYKMLHAAEKERRWAMDQRRVSVVMISLGVSLFVSAVVLVLWQPFIVKAQEVKRFEYRIVEVLPDTLNMQTKLNEFGVSGWELVAVSMGNMTEPRLIFKK